MQEYRIGCNGPDFLFFHDILPLWKKQNKRVSRIGGKIHQENINLFYKIAIQIYHDEKDLTIKEALASYICGHFLHWRLDSIMHPYVVYRTGFNEPTSSGYHHRFESMMDTILLKKYWNYDYSSCEGNQSCVVPDKNEENDLANKSFK